ncbi:MAG: DNA repair exonuclease [Hyphomicrobiaceae bacterium]
MAFRLIHSADWHIAKPFGAFDTERALRLREARIGAIDRIAEVARAAGASVVLVAGDVFDSPGVADDVLRRTLAKLGAQSTLVWHLLPGNHDAATAGGIWERVARIGLPANVVVHARAEPVTLAPGIALLPSPLVTRHAASDPTAWMDQAVTAPGIARIGLAHGAVQGFGSSGEAATPLSTARARSAGLAYLALGDWHGRREVAPRTWYSGTPEPDRFLDNEPGYVLAVEVGGVEQAIVTPHRVADHIWLRREISVGVADGLAAVEGEIAALGARADRALLQLEIRGRLTLAGDHALGRRLDALAPRLMHLDLRRDALDIGTDDIGEALLADPTLAAVARALAARVEAAASPREFEIARQALRRLAALADGDAGAPAIGATDDGRAAA